SSLQLFYSFLLFFFYHPSTTLIYTLSLHDALPIFEFALQLRNHEADSLGGAGRGGNHVQRGCARTAQIFVREVENVLIVGVGVKDRKSTRLNSSHQIISYAVFCLKKKKQRISKEHR